MIPGMSRWRVNSMCRLGFTFTGNSSMVVMRSSPSAKTAPVTLWFPFELLELSCREPPAIVPAGVVLHLEHADAPLLCFEAGVHVVDAVAESSGEDALEGRHHQGLGRDGRRIRPEASPPAH
jgi:hypothetical protein